MREKVGVLIVAVLTLSLLVFPVMGYAKQLKAKLGHPMPPPHWAHRGYVEFAKYVEAESNGSIKIEIFPLSQLGPDRSMMEQLQAGTLEMAIITTGSLESLAPEFAAFSLPFVFPNDDTAWTVLQSKEIRDRLFPLIEAKGLHPLGFGAATPRSLQNTKKPIRTPEDLKGLKFRTLPSPIFIDVFKAIGAIPVSLPFPEIYTALEQGLVDGEDSTLDAAWQMKFLELEKYVTMSGHVTLVVTLNVSNAFWNKLTKDQQGILEEGARRNERYARDADAKDRIRSVKIAKDDFKAAVIELTPAERQAFVTAVQPVHTKYRKVVGSEFYDFFLKKVGELSQ